MWRGAIIHLFTHSLTFPFLKNHFSPAHLLSGPISFSMLWLTFQCRRLSSFRQYVVDLWREKSSQHRTGVSFGVHLWLIAAYLFFFASVWFFTYIYSHSLLSLLQGIIASSMLYCCPWISKNTEPDFSYIAYRVWFYAETEIPHPYHASKCTHWAKHKLFRSGRRQGRKAFVLIISERFAFSHTFVDAG